MLDHNINVPAGKQNWTEHRYNNKGIQIILYKGKKKKFIYLKYIVNPRRIFEGKDYLNLLEPSETNIARLWNIIKQTWNEIGCNIPFDRFSRLDFTCDVHLETEELVTEYIRLLGKSILLPSYKKFSVNGIYHDIPADTKIKLQKNCYKFEVTSCENIQCYNKIFELQNEGLPILQNAASQNTNILRIELQIHKTKRITELLQAFLMHNNPIKEQFSFFMKHADMFLLDRLEKLYSPGYYHQKQYIRNFIKNDPSLRSKSRDRVKNFLEDCNRNITLGRCLEIDRQNGCSLKREKSLKYLSEHQMSPICILASLVEYDKLPDIFDLISSDIESV